MTRKPFTDLCSDPSLETPVVPERNSHGYLLASECFIHNHAWYGTLVLPPPVLWNFIEPFIKELAKTIHDSRLSRIWVLTEVCFSAAHLGWGVFCTGPPKKEYLSQMKINAYWGLVPWIRWTLSFHEWCSTSFGLNHALTNNCVMYQSCHLTFIWNYLLFQPRLSKRKLGSNGSH